MEETTIRTKIKQIISNITSIDSTEIGDSASFVDDLDLDSLSMLEIGVDVAYEFKLDIPEEELSELRTLDDSVRLVQDYLSRQEPQAQAV
jgi:acyl carrier protein